MTASRACNYLQNAAATTYKKFLQFYAKRSCQKQNNGLHQCREWDRPRPVAGSASLRSWQDLIRHIRNKAFRSFKAINIFDGFGNLPGSHSFGIHGNDLLINIGNIFLTFFHNLWFKR